MASLLVQTSHSTSPLPHSVQCDISDPDNLLQNPSRRCASLQPTHQLHACALYAITSLNGPLISNTHHTTFMANISVCPPSTGQSLPSALGMSCSPYIVLCTNRLLISTGDA